MRSISMAELENLTSEIDRLGAQLGQARAEISKRIIGQDQVVSLALAAMLSNGHALLMGLPGLGKTRLVDTMAQVMGLRANRVQFTPDLMPADILGSEVLDTGPDGQRSFRFLEGPVFCHDDMLEVKICNKSGYRASSICEETELRYIQISGKKTRPCPYHRLVHVDTQEKYQVNSSCEPIENIKNKPWFVLPPLQAFYYKNKNPFYKPIPPFREGCLSDSDISMEFIYPNQHSTVFLPKDFNGKTNDLVLKVAHSKPELELFWYVDNVYIGSTKEIHDMAILPNPGEYTLTVVDELGNELKHKITVAD